MLPVKAYIGVLVSDNESIVGDALMNIVSPSSALIYEDKKNVRKLCQNK